MLALLACLPMLWPPSICTCQLLPICGVQTEHVSEVSSNDTTLSQADSECHCAVRISTTVPQNDSLITVVLIDAFVPQLTRILVAQNVVTPLCITPSITSNSLLLQHCALIL